MTVSVRKTIPATSNFYTTGGDQTVILKGTNEMTFHTKKSLIKIPRPKSKARQIASPSDQFDNQVVDLKNGTDEVIIRGWLEDTTSDTAWEKFWRLRAMCSNGGPVTNLTIDNIQFKSDTQEAFLEDVTGMFKNDDLGVLNANNGEGVGRVEVTLQFFIGDER